MKLKASKKELKNSYSRIISIGYCNAQHLMSFENPFSYCTRVEGWACDNYDFDGVLISTGYSPIQSKNMKRDYDITRHYDDEAMKIKSDYSKSREEQKIEVRELLKKYIAECKE